MATHLSILAWEIPWMEEPCGESTLDSKNSLQDSHESHESLQALLITQEPVATLSQPWPWGLETEVQ